MKNANTRESLERIRTQVLENLAAMPPAPSVQLTAAVPPKVEQVGARARGAARWVACGFVVRGEVWRG
jgi:hypothetical protein